MNEWENGVSLDQFFSHIHKGGGRKEGNGTLKNLKEGGKGNWEKATVYKLAVMFWYLMTCPGFPQKVFLKKIKNIVSLFVKLYKMVKKLY